MVIDHSVLKGLTALIDADILVYRCGFAVKDDEPFPEADLNNVKHVMEKLVEVFPVGYRAYISGKTNFRDEVATIKEYKGNRNDKRKPRAYDEIRTYLQTRWGAAVIEGQEADDALGIEQFKNKDKSTCIVSIDKDMDMIPGYHYNWVKEEPYYINIVEANINFFRQMMVGDPSDNIPGIDKVGKITAQKIIDEVAADAVELRNRVERLYEKQYGDGWRRAYQEVATLLWIRREENQACPYL